MQVRSDQGAVEAVSLAKCDQEPVHIPGHVQDFAVLIAADAKLSEVTHCSANAASLLGQSAEEILGAKLSDVVDDKLIHDLRNVLSLSSVSVQRERVTIYERDGKILEVWAHLSDGLPVIEFEQVPHEEEEHTRSILIVRSLLARLQNLESTEKSLEDAVLALRGLSGFDRVMAYKFDANGDGEVVAEARGPDLEPFIGLRFPKWDIPNQARAIMAKLPLRMIADIDAPPVPLHAADPAAPPLDLTFAASRGQSPIHSEYLSNMGIAGTMTLSIVVGEKLWGLLAFHHAVPRRIGPSLRGAAEVFVQFFSLQIQQRLERGRTTARSQALEHQTALLDAADTAPSLTDLVKDIAAPYCKLLGADGLAFISEDSVIEYGLTPKPDIARAIGKALLVDPNADLVTADCLKDAGFEAGKCAGALAMRLMDKVEYHVLFFRKEAALSVRWAGAPSKDIVEDQDGPRLKPRGSFKAYQQSVADRCLPWEDSTLASAQEVRLALAKADAALYRRLSQKQERQRSIYIAELNHRVRNILALIRSLSRRAQESSNSLDSYARALEQRIAALGAAHDLAANRISDGVSINAVFEMETKPYLREGSQQLFISGKSYLMRSDVAPIFALVAHELVTNCVKYGALSGPHGEIHIDVTGDEEGITIVWREQGGPPVKQATRRGFGLGLIEKAVPYELDGDSNVEFLPEGLKATFWLPATLVEPLPEAFEASERALNRKDKTVAHLPSSILVVEDSMMVAMDMVDMLQQIGIKEVHTSASVAQAKRALEGFMPDFAVLDMSLREGNSFEIAALLKQRDVPFCFATGYGSDHSLPEDLAGTIILTKPVDSASLGATILALYQKGKA